MHKMWSQHDDVIKWKYFPRYWPFVREIHRSPVNFPHKGQWRGALMFTLICDRMNGWVNNHEAGDSRRYLAHCDVIVMNIIKMTKLWDKWNSETKNWLPLLPESLSLSAYSISQEICTRFLLCCALLWLCIDWFSHIHQAYFTGTVAI